MHAASTVMLISLSLLYHSSEVMLSRFPALWGGEELGGGRGGGEGIDHWKVADSSQQPPYSQPASPRPTSYPLLFKAALLPTFSPWQPKCTVTLKLLDYVPCSPCFFFRVVCKRKRRSRDGAERPQSSHGKLSLSAAHNNEVGEGNTEQTISCTHSTQIAEWKRECFIMEIWVFRLMHIALGIKSEQNVSLKVNAASLLSKIKGL